MDSKEKNWLCKSSVSNINRLYTMFIDKNDILKICLFMICTYIMNLSKERTLTFFALGTIVLTYMWKDEGKNFQQY